MRNTEILLTTAFVAHDAEFLAALGATIHHPATRNICRANCVGHLSGLGSDLVGLGENAVKFSGGMRHMYTYTKPFQHKPCQA